jgi:hypothetical protein
MQDCASTSLACAQQLSSDAAVLFVLDKANPVIYLCRNPANRCAAASLSSQALTQFHVLLLAAGRLLLVSRVSGQAVQEVALPSLGSSLAPQPPAAAASPALLRDEETSTVYLAAGEAPESMITCPGRISWSIREGMRTPAQQGSRVLMGGAGCRGGAI